MNEQKLTEFLNRAANDFSFFVKWIYFKYSFPKELGYECPVHVVEWSDIFQKNKNVSLLSARKHLKSITAYAYVMWRIFRNMKDADYELLYLSYNSDMAAYHLANVKRLIEINPFFYQLIHKTDAQSILHCQKPGGRGRISIEPAGILTFKRGRHPHEVICDDILADPTNVMEPAIIDKITRTFFEDILSLPKEDGFGVKLVGTAQHETDIFFQLKDKKSFSWHMYPAIQDELNQIVLWNSIFSWQRLLEIKDEIGPKAFLKEYMCIPVHTADSFFTQEQILSVVDKGLVAPHKIEDRFITVIAGWDIGKHVHPSHFSAFRDDGTHITQVCNIFMDNMEYIRQVELVNMLVENLSIDKVYVDITRGEMEGFLEQRMLNPTKFIPIRFNLKIKNSLAAEFEKKVTTKTIKLLNHDRMIRQILTVNNDLNAMTTVEGHGDAFWSIALACYGYSIHIQRRFLIA